MNMIQTFFAYRNAYLEQDGTDVEIDAQIHLIHQLINNEDEFGTQLEAFVMMCDETGIVVTEED